MVVESGEFVTVVSVCCRLSFVVLRRFSSSIGVVWKWLKSESHVLKTRSVKNFVRFLRMNEFSLPKVKDSSDKSSFCFKFIVLIKLYFKFIVLINKTLVCFFFLG